MVDEIIIESVNAVISDPRLRSIALLFFAMLSVLKEISKGVVILYNFFRNRKKKQLNQVSSDEKIALLIKAIKEEITYDCLGYIKINGTERLLIDESKTDALKDMSEDFNADIFREAKEEMKAESGLWIVETWKYETDNGLSKSLVKNGISSFYAIPKNDKDNNLTGYLVVGYFATKMLDVTDFHNIKERLNEI